MAVESRGNNNLEHPCVCLSTPAHTMPTPPGLPGLKRAAPDGPSRDDEANKSRRRAVSCISCQRMKCRCDYDFALQSCTRCYNLK